MTGIEAQLLDLGTSSPALVVHDAESEGPAEESTEAPVLVPGGLVSAHRVELAAKRALDIVGSVTALILLSPVLLAAALAVALSSPGPVFYRQERIGRGGSPFRMLKFRSMRDGAHYERPLLVDLNESAGPVFKIKKDPRITAVGRVLRKLSIDELPQLLNVLGGRMSLVGPRPPLPEEYHHYGPREHLRLLVKPGMTCLWQVGGRSDLDFDTWVELDIRYIQTWSLWLDLKLLAQTVPAVLSGRGAY